MDYPVSIAIEPKLPGRNRLTTAFRPLLAVPHAILVGPLYWSSRGSGVGLLGAAVYVTAVVSWFTLVFNGTHIQGIRDLSLYYLRWRVRALAYMALFVDAYPPFGDGDYATTISVADPTRPRDRMSIALRLLIVLPHVFLLCLLTIGWFLTTIIAWFSILFSGAYPASLLPFGVGVMRWLVRVEAYLLLLVDDYPPFGFE